LAVPGFLAITLEVFAELTAMGGYVVLFSTCSMLSKGIQWVWSTAMLAFKSFDDPSGVNSLKKDKETG
jgi:hypothetical protein